MGAQPPLQGGGRVHPVQANRDAGPQARQQILRHVEGSRGPDGVDSVHILGHEGLQQLGMALDIGQAAQHAHLGLVGHGGVIDERPPCALLRLRRRDGGAGLGGALTPRGRAVPVLLGADLLLPEAAGSHQSGQQVPAQVLVDVEPVKSCGPLQKSGDGVELLVRHRVGGQSPHQLELLVASGRGCPGQLQ